MRSGYGLLNLAMSAGCTWLQYKVVWPTPYVFGFGTPARARPTPVSAGCTESLPQLTSCLYVVAGGIPMFCRWPWGQIVIRTSQITQKHLRMISN